MPLSKDTHDHRSLLHRRLFELALDIDTSAVSDAGEVENGVRRLIVPVVKGVFSGDEMQGTVVCPAYDWVLMREDRSFSIDVRMTLKTDDDATIYMNYKGRFIPKEGDYSLTVVANLECGSEQYQWLNNAVVVGIGERGNGTANYTFYEVL